MKINALVKGATLNRYNWIHEDGLIVMEKIIDLDDEELFVVYNIDTHEYGIARNDDFIYVGEKPFNKKALVNRKGLPEDKDITIEININVMNPYEETNNYELNDYDLTELIEAVENYESEIYDLDDLDDLGEIYDLDDLDYGEYLEYDEENGKNYIEISLEDLAHLIDKGWDDSQLSRILQDLLYDDFDEDFDDLF